MELAHLGSEEIKASRIVCDSLLDCGKHEHRHRSDEALEQLEAVDRKLMLARFEVWLPLRARMRVFGPGQRVRVAFLRQATVTRHTVFSV